MSIKKQIEFIQLHSSLKSITSENVIIPKNMPREMRLKIDMFSLFINDLDKFI